VGSGGGPLALVGRQGAGPYDAWGMTRMQGAPRNRRGPASARGIRGDTLVLAARQMPAGWQGVSPGGYWEVRGTHEVPMRTIVTDEAYDPYSRP
jgi:hypothetical protein